MAYSTPRNESLYFTLDADGAFTDELAIATKYLVSADRVEIVRELRDNVFDALAPWTIGRSMSAQISCKSHNNAHQSKPSMRSLVGFKTLVPWMESYTTVNDELLLESEEIIERISPSTWRWSFKQRPGFTYVNGDPGFAAE